MSGCVFTGIARNQRGLKELPGSRSEADASDGHSDMSFDLEDINIPEMFFQTAPPSDRSDLDG